MPSYKSVKMEHVSFLKQLFIAFSVQNQIRLVLIENDVNTVYEITFQRNVFKMRHTDDIVQINQTRGFYL